MLTGYDVPVETTRARLAPYAQRDGWAKLTAIRQGQLHAIEHGLCRALFDYTAMYYLAKQIFPGPFADIDPVDELRRYHEAFLPVRFEGTQLYTARWVEGGDPAEIKRFKEENRPSLADDHTGALVFLARNAWHLERTEKDFPKLTFAKVKEQAPS